MIKSIQGTLFKFELIPAIAARELLAKMEGDLSKLRPHIAVNVDGRWVELGGDKLVEMYVPNWEVLSLAEQEAYELNFGFLATWQPHHVPDEMKATNYAVAESKNVDPSVSALVSNGMATYLELRDSLSLEEMFKLLDILTVKRINEYRSQKAANKQ
jgi:hypothetical protein